MRTSRLIAAVGATALAGSAAAQYTFTDSGPINVVAGTGFELDISGGTTGTSYNSVDISVDWNPGTLAWSNEAFVGIYSGSGLTGTNFFPLQFSPDGLSGANGYNPVTLTWSGSLNADYIGGDSLFLYGDQYYLGSDANWSNLSVTLNEGVSPVYLLSDTATNNVPVMGTTVYDLVIDANGTDVSIDTFGTAAFGSNDTELFLLDSDGLTLIDANDDGGGMGFLSQIQTTLDAGTYTVVVGGYNTTYGGGGVGDFASTNADSGDVVVNVSTLSGTGASLTLVPEPGSLALLGLGGLLIARRRRSA